MQSTMVIYKFWDENYYPDLNSGKDDTFAKTDSFLWSTAGEYLSDQAAKKLNFYECAITSKKIVS